MARDVLRRGQRADRTSGSATRDEAMTEAADILVEAGAVDRGLLRRDARARGDRLDVHGQRARDPARHERDQGHDPAAPPSRSCATTSRVDWDGEPVTGSSSASPARATSTSRSCRRSRSSSPTRTTVAAPRDAAQPPEELLRPALRGQRVDEGRPLRRRQHRARLRRPAAARGRLRARVLRRQRRRSSTRSTASDRYTVHEVGDGGRDRVVDRLPRDQQRRRTPTSAASTRSRRPNVVTTAVGPTILRFVAPHIVAGLRCATRRMPRRCRSWRARTRSTPPTCCATRSRRSRAAEEWPSLAARAVFANTAVDRIVPGAGRRRRRRRRHRRAVLRVGDRASAVRRRRRPTSRARTSSTTSRRTSSASSSP